MRPLIKVIFKNVHITHGYNLNSIYQMIEGFILSYYVYKNEDQHIHTHSYIHMHTYTETDATMTK